MATLNKLTGVGFEPTQAKYLDSNYVDATDAESVAAAGSAQGDAAALSSTKFWSVVTAADGVKGVILPSTTKIGQTRVIQSTAAAVLKIYPATGGTINALSANAALSSISGPVTLFARCTGSNTWTIA